MTLDTLNNPGYDGPWTYSGARADLGLMRDLFLNWNLPLLFVFTADLPFSAVADTLVLPLTIPRERRRLAEVESARRVDVERPSLVQPEPGEKPEATAQRLFERCREAVRTMNDELLHCYSVGARITVREPDSGEPRERLSGEAYKLVLREALPRQRDNGEVIDWQAPAFEREGEAVRVQATRTSSRTAATHPLEWRIGPGPDGGWRILEEDGIGWPEPPPRE
jgi:uncharacterized protein YceK